MSATKTNWDKYYSKPAATASVTRKITTNKLINCLRMYDGNLQEAHIAEFGGANSCFFTTIQNEIAPKEYWIVDNNKTGLDLFKKNYPESKNVSLYERDVLAFTSFPKPADIAFSVGLIEHFQPNETAKSIEAHFHAVRSGGLVIISFPTPTPLYRTTRKLIEVVGKWIFHDERPLSIEEVRGTVEKYANIIHIEINWPILLTQGIIVARKK